VNRKLVVAIAGILLLPAINFSPRGTVFDRQAGSVRIYVKDPDRSIVVVSADLSYPRAFWSSPTPQPTTN